MARNVSRTFATMDDDERRRFALEQTPKEPDEVEPIVFPEDPRKAPAEDERREEGRA